MVCTAQELGGQDPLVAGWVTGLDSLVMSEVASMKRIKPTTCQATQQAKLLMLLLLLLLMLLISSVEKKVQHAVSTA